LADGFKAPHRLKIAKLSLEANITRRYLREPIRTLLARFEMK
jgi:hypothetical protein